jgi:hypothetical protein
MIMCSIQKEKIRGSMNLKDVNIYIKKKTHTHTHTHARTHAHTHTHTLIFFVALQPNASHGLFILVISRSHTTHQSVEHLWKSDQLVAIYTYIYI